MVILWKSRSFFFSNFFFFPPSFLYFSSPVRSFLYRISLCLSLYLFFLALSFVFYFYFTIAGWSCCSLQTVGSCLERRNGNERWQVIKIREDSSETFRAECGLP